ncbi:MAG: hypothetical protein WBL72_26490 [Thermoguttaceae bacterium]
MSARRTAPSCGRQECPPHLGKECGQGWRHLVAHGYAWVAAIGSFAG